MTTPTESPINPSTRKGITLRDYFAGQAIGRIWSDCDIGGGMLACAREAYRLADAMMEARKQDDPP